MSLQREIEVFDHILTIEQEFSGNPTQNKTKQEIWIENILIHH